MTDLAQQRALARHLLDERSAADAMAAYYALEHSAARTRLFLHYAAAGRVDGVLVRAQTGADLFRPLVMVRAPNSTAAAQLLQAGLQPGRPYYLVMPAELGAVAFRELEITELQLLCQYVLYAHQFKPLINVLVQRATGSDGAPRYEIRAQDRVRAWAGVNWRSDYFAEVYVQVEQAVRGRGWGRAVVAALAKELLGAGVQPLYSVSQGNQSSIMLAEALGFVDNGNRELAGFANLPAEA